MRRFSHPRPGRRLALATMLLAFACAPAFAGGVPVPDLVPPDSLLQSFVSLRIEPEHPCGGDSITLQLVKNGCPPCFHLVSFGPAPDSSSLFAGVAQWTPVCNERSCVAETLSTPMGRLAAGTFQVSAPMTVIVHRLPDPDTTISFRLPLTI